MRRFFILIVIALMCGTTACPKKKKQLPETKPAPKRELRKPAQPGLFGVQQHKDDWYLQVADSLIGRLFLVNTRYVSTPVDASLYGGELANSQVIYFEKHGKELLIRCQMYDAVADSTQEIARAVRAANEDPIIAALKLDTVETRKDSIYSIKVTDLLKGDNPAFSLFSTAKNRLGLTGIKSELSYIDYIHTFPLNTEIATVKTFSSKTAATMPAGQQTGLVTIRLNTSVVLLPKEPMRYRSFDARVGYFTDSHREYADNQHQVKNRRIAVRWRLEPRPEDVERYRRGELVEPRKQIVYYIDPATPKQWRKYLIQGVEDWNGAFEQAGWKNAITAREWPEDSTMSLEDARYSVIRYLASPISNAYGPQIHDPRSGEIIETHIGWYHNVMQLLHDWYMIQAGAIDPKARTMKMDDELMGQLIRFVSSHEVGHTLGLRHNMGASSATPTDSLRNKRWVEQHGHTASIMDYARFNYVAQPEDNISRAGIFPRINDYDRWAIQWGYTWFPDAKDAEEERLLLNNLTVAQLAKGRRYWFGGEGGDNDPRAQTEDLGDDPFKASDYGILNLKRIVKQLPEWSHEEADMDDNLAQVYASLRQQMQRYVGHVCRNIGGVYHDYKSVEQTGPVYVAEEKSRQKQALQWLDRQVLQCPRWLIAEDYVLRLTSSPERLIHPLADQTLTYMLGATTLNNLCRNSYARDSYQPADYVSDVVSIVFRETTTGARPDAWRRYVQQQAVACLVKTWSQTNGESSHAVALMALRLIRQRIKSAANAGDATTRAHYAELAWQIDKALEIKH
ncbi:MAG: zinc-dependent metalloprotease [Prevotella sp.]|nr:zinc-dependent metalloprotease [Prevotella sp.]